MLGRHPTALQTPRPQRQAPPLWSPGCACGRGPISRCTQNPGGGPPHRAPRRQASHTRLTSLSRHIKALQPPLTPRSPSHPHMGPKRAVDATATPAEALWAQSTHPPLTQHTHVPSLAVQHSCTTILVCASALVPLVSSAARPEGQASWRPQPLTGQREPFPAPSLRAHEARAGGCHVAPRRAGAGTQSPG